MPQASDEQRDVMKRWFGDYVDDKGPMQFLASRGYELTGDWRWKPPVPSHTVRDEEWECIRFLIDEWDFGGITKP